MGKPEKKTTPANPHLSLALGPRVTRPWEVGGSRWGVTGSGQGQRMGVSCESATGCPTQSIGIGVVDKAGSGARPARPQPARMHQLGPPAGSIAAPPACFAPGLTHLSTPSRCRRPEVLLFASPPLEALPWSLPGRSRQDGGLGLDGVWEVHPGSA